MLKFGYTIPQVVLYYLMYNVIDVPLNFAARSFVKIFGARFAIAIGTLVSITFFWIFANITEPTLAILAVLAALAAAYDTLFWVAHFYLFIESGGTAKEAAKSTGTMYAVRQFAVVLGPAVGAGILIFATQQILLYITISGLLISLIPLSHLGGLPDRPRHKTVPYKKFFAHPDGRRTFLSAALYAVHDSVESILFPIFIFLIFGTIESVALIPVLVSCAAIVTAIVLGHIHPSMRTRAIAADLSPYLKARRRAGDLLCDRSRH